MEPSQAGAGQASTLDDILTGLTDSQHEAVLHSQGPLLVITQRQLISGARGRSTRPTSWP